jgi:hypothetical protein
VGDEAEAADHVAGNSQLIRTAVIRGLLVVFGIERLSDRLGLWQGLGLRGLLDRWRGWRSSSDGRSRRSFLGGGV